MYPVSSSQSQQGEKEHQAVTVHDGMVGKALGLPASPDELHDSEEPPVDAALLPVLQHQHEEEAEAGLHHHPVHCAQQVDVCGQERNIPPLVEWRCPVLQDLAKFQCNKGHYHS